VTPVVVVAGMGYRAGADTAKKPAMTEHAIKLELLPAGYGAVSHARHDDYRSHRPCATDPSAELASSFRSSASAR
jgi:hypothetical protein